MTLVRVATTKPEAALLVFAVSLEQEPTAAVAAEFRNSDIAKSSEPRLGRFM